MPTTFLIDPAGHTVARFEGSDQQVHAKLEAAVRTLLSGGTLDPGMDVRVSKGLEASGAHQGVAARVPRRSDHEPRRHGRHADLPRARPRQQGGSSRRGRRLGRRLWLQLILSQELRAEGGGGSAASFPGSRPDSGPSRRAMSRVSRRSTRSFSSTRSPAGRTQVLNPLILWNQDFGKSGGQLSLNLGYDSISGASPTGAYPTSDVTTSASGTVTASGNFPQASYTDARKSAGLSYGRAFGANLPTVNLTYAKENDYTARAIGFTDSWTMIGGRGTLHFGVALLARHRLAGQEPGDQSDRSESELPEEHQRLLPRLELGLRRARSRRHLLFADESLRLPQRPVQGRPDRAGRRERDAPRESRRPRAPAARSSLKYSHYFLWGASVNVLYRFYNDDWSITANTIDVNLQPEDRLRLDRLAGGSLLHPDRRVVLRQPIPRRRRPTCPPTIASPLSAASCAGLTISSRLYDSISANLGVTYLSQNSNDPIHLAPSISGARGARPCRRPT